MFDDEPKYKKLFNTLRSDILSGKYAVDRPLPSFRALMQRQGLSISTVRHAFDELAREGLVVRIRGAGTYVSKQAVSRKIGLILPGVAYSDYFLPIVSEISRQAQEHGYMLIFGTVKSSDPKARAKMAVRFNVPRNLLSESTTRTILQIVRELVVNAIRHGQAKHIRIAGEMHENTVSFSVADNGRGFDPKAAPGPEQGHFGLLGIRERIEDFNRTLKIGGYLLTAREIKR